MRYRISKSQIKMLLDGKSLNTGNGRRVLVLNGSKVYKELEKIMANPVTADKMAFFTTHIKSNDSTWNIRAGIFFTENH